MLRIFPITELPINILFYTIVMVRSAHTFVHKAFDFLAIRTTDRSAVVEN